MIIDELITILGFDIQDMSKLDKYKSSIKQGISELKSMATVATATMGVMLAGITSVNNETTKMTNLSEAMGVDINLVQGLGHAVKSIGLDYEHVTDLAEELNNKIGESKSIYQDWLKGDKLEGKKLKLVGGVEDSFKGLDFSIIDKKFKGLDLEHQFKLFSSKNATEQLKLVMDTASKMKDAQKAASMVDILLGGEANKILSLLRSKHMTLSELIKAQEKMNFLDKEGIAGAKAYSAEISNAKGIWHTIIQQFSGIMGKYLTPIVKKTDEWITAHKKIIQVDIKKYVVVIIDVFRRLFHVVGMVWRGIDKLAQSFGGWSSIMPILATIIAYFNPWKMAIVGILLVLDDLYAYFNGGSSVIGRFIAYFKQNFPILNSIVESLGDVFYDIFSLFGALYNALIRPVLDLFKTDSTEASDSILSSFSNSFRGMGILFRSVINIIDDLIRYLTAIFSGNFASMKQIGVELFSHLIDGFDGVVIFFTNGATTFRTIWGNTIDWIMKKINWVTNKIETVKKVGSNIIDGAKDIGSNIVNSVKNIFSFDDKKSTKEIRSSTSVLKIKESVSKVKESIKHTNTNVIQKLVPTPQIVPAPANSISNNHKNYNIAHTHNNQYSINVSAQTGATPSVIATEIKEKIIDTKSIEKANIDRAIAPYKDR